ncbi:MAG: putative membrane protein [Lentisphaeria bacterium]|jgi:uncharacterized membrane protein
MSFLKIVKSFDLVVILYVALSLFVATILAWGIMMQGNFFYGVWHDHGGIAEGIEKYGPQNRYKEGFAETTRQQRIEIFAEISRAIHCNGEGLWDIAYSSSSSDGEQTLLREAEVVHLTDVAHLISLMKIAATLGSVFWLAILVCLLKARAKLPLLRHQMLGLAGIFFVGGLVLFAAGAEDVFNLLHIWIFPDNHQWFFYYQDSLMSTMMLAPTLFGWIAAAWAVLALGVFIVVHFIVLLAFRRIKAL